MPLPRMRRLFLRWGTKSMEPAPLSAVSRFTLGSVGRRFRWWLILVLGLACSRCFLGRCGLIQARLSTFSALTQVPGLVPAFVAVGHRADVWRHRAARETGIDNPGLHARVGSDFDTFVELSAELDKLEPGGQRARSRSAYTMTLPVLSFFRKEGGVAAFSDEIWQFYAKFIRRLARPVVVALMANHFSAPSPLLDELRKGPQNLMWLPSGCTPGERVFREYRRPADAAYRPRACLPIAIADKR